MREMKDSGIAWIGETPKEWVVLPHKYIMHKRKEIQEHYSGEDIISLTMNGVVVRDLSAGGKIPLTFDGYQKVYKGNLLQCLFDIDVTPRCVGLIKNDGVTSPAYSQFEVHQEGYAPYYDYLLRYMDDNKVLLHLSKNLRSSLTETDFGTIPTVLPSFREQQSIANFLDEKCGEIDELVALQEKMIEELKAYKQSVITETVTKGLQPNVKMKDSGVEWIGKIPEHWAVVRLKNEINFVNGYAFKSDDFTIDEGIKVIRIGDIADTIDFRGCVRAKVSNEGLATYRIRENDILIAMSGATTGKCGIAKDVNEAYINQRVGIIRTEKYRFIYYSLHTNYLFEYINLHNSGSAQPNISSTSIGNYPIPCPPLSEQHSIATYLDEKCSEIDSLISIKQKKIEELKDYKKSLIYEYVTGKKQVG